MLPSPKKTDTGKWFPCANSRRRRWNRMLRRAAEMGDFGLAYREFDLEGFPAHMRPEFDEEETVRVR